jgi:DNA repair protein RecN (Recombination protein N)
MLDSVTIKNFALIDYLELEFGSGLNVLTGETGAGKSIVLDAIDVVLGGKVNQRLVRQGEKRAHIEASFRIDPDLLQWLQQQQIEPLEEEIIICSREIILAKENVRSRFRINGVLVNRQLVLQLRDRLIEITAQGQTVELMISDKQRQLLDLYGGVDLLNQRQKVTIAYEISEQIRKTLAKKRQSEQERLQRLDLIQYQSQELASVNLSSPDELSQLEQDRERLAHVVELQDLSYRIYQLLYQNEQGEAAAADLLGEGEALLRDMVKYDPNLDNILTMVNNALTGLVEAGQQIYRYGENLEVDPQSLEQIAQRVQQLKHICRKYGPTLPEAIAYQENLKLELQEITENTEVIEHLEQEYTQAQANLNHACQQLTLLRQQAAVQLETELTTELKPLGMEKVIFSCQILNSTITANGGDQIIYYFTPNPGEPIQPLSYTASGGEMSRFLLALKSCFANTQTNSKTLIFDEIDVGVSGKVAQTIATKLHYLSKTHQVLCVTHQPLVAAMADTHFRVEKQTVDLRTVVRIVNLSDHQQRREELAQLSGGQADSEAIAFAESLITQAKAKRQ